MTTPEPPLPNLLGFIADEDKEFQASLARDRADITLCDQIQGFYEAALAEVKVHENEIPIFQILTFSHYHFPTATAALMRCHLSEMLGAVRIAIDAALIGAQIIADRGFADRVGEARKALRQSRPLLRESDQGQKAAPACACSGAACAPQKAEWHLQSR
jgi:hypothetical protein